MGGLCVTLVVQFVYGLSHKRNDSKNWNAGVEMSIHYIASRINDIQFREDIFADSEKSKLIQYFFE